MFDSYLYTRLKIKSSKKVFVNFFGRPASSSRPPPLARLLSIMDQQLLQTVSQLKTKLLFKLPFFKYEKLSQFSFHPIKLNAKHFNHVQIALKNF